MLPTALFNFLAPFSFLSFLALLLPPTCKTAKFMYFVTHVSWDLGFDFHTSRQASGEDWGGVPEILAIAEIQPQL